MPIVKLPDGSIVNVAEGTTPERLAQITAEHAAKTPQLRDSRGLAGVDASAPVRGITNPWPKQSGEQREVTRRVMVNRPAMDKRSGATDWIASFGRGATYNFDDEIQGALSAGTRGVFNAARHLDPSEISKEYRVARDTLREENKYQDNQNRHYLSGEIAGALLSPVNKVAAPLGAAAKAAPYLGRVAALPVRAAAIGAGYGALNGAGASEGDSVGAVAGDALNGGAMGAVTGGVLGSAGAAGLKVAKVVQDLKPAAAARTAFNRVGDLIGKTPIAPGSKMKMTPLRAERELAVANGRGTDAIVADLSPGLQAQTAKLARNPQLDESNAIIAQANGRMGERGQALEDQIKGLIQPKTGTDALKFQAANTGARRAAGQRDYDAVLDKPIAWTKGLTDFVTKDNPLIKSALGRAYDILKKQDIDPKTVGLVFGPDGVLQKVERPTMRAFDYLKRGLDKVSQDAKSAKDYDTSRIAGDQLDILKKLIGEVNPKYKDVLATQTSHFKLDEATELGKSVASRLTGAKADPRVLLEDIKKIHPDNFDALRTGFADAMINLRDTKTAGRGPMAVLTAMTKSPNQRAVLERMFEGKANFGRFSKWLARETKAAKTDSMTAGPQSITSLMQGTETAGEGAQKLLTDSARGFAFGGPVGGVTGGMRAVANLASGTSKSAQDEMARILMSNGKGLQSGISSAKAFELARRMRNQKIVGGIAKAGQQPFTDYVGK